MMKWGDAFAARVPTWIEMLTRGCNCKNVQLKMNDCDEKSARILFNAFRDAVMKNSKRSAILRMVPKDKLTAAVDRRMRLAFKDAFGVDL